MKLFYSLARILSRIAEAKAMDICIPMSIAIADEQGNPLCFGHMDNALPASRDLATAKASTAARLRMSTRDLGRLAQPGRMLYGIENALQESIVVFGGGVPLQIDGRVVGAVGISGGTVEQDVRVAEAVSEALALMEAYAKKIHPVFSREKQGTHLLRRIQKQFREVASKIDPSADETVLHIASGAAVLASKWG